MESKEHLKNSESRLSYFLAGILKGNPVLVLMIGLCPVLAISTTLFNGVGMSIAVAFVLLGSNLIVSALKKFIPPNLRIPIFIIVISTFVTTAEYLIKAYIPDLHRQLGVFLPLIVVNCIIIGRSEAFAYRNTVFKSILDAVGTSIGFFIVLVLISSIRQITGQGDFLGITLFRNPALVMAFPPGGFFTIGFLIALLRYYNLKKKRSKE